MFTDRFIKLPVQVFSIKEKELIGVEIYSDSYIKINPFELSEYRPSEGDDETEECVTIIMKNGEKALIQLSIDDFEKLINKNNEEKFNV